MAKKTIRELVYKQLKSPWYGWLDGLIERIHDDHKDLRMCDIARVVYKLYDDGIIKDNHAYSYLYIEGVTK